MSTVITPPQDDSRAAEIESQTSVQSQPPAAASVLVVDDDPMMLKLIQAALAKTSTTVSGVASVAECLRVLGERHPDAILLDIVLPDMNGLEAFRRVHDLAPKVPVIFITATNSSDTAIEAMKIGAFDYLM